MAPYITRWSEEKDPPFALVESLGGGIAYRDEVIADRDSRGILWFRTPFRPGRGRPEFGQVHPLRQRRAMRRLLCQVCAGPADRTDDGVLWLLKDHHEDWPLWPNGMGVTEPPICTPCVRLSIRMCPALRKGAALVRARAFPVSGVHGAIYVSGNRGPVFVGKDLAAFEDPAVRWMRAMCLVRELEDSTILSLDDPASK